MTDRELLAAYLATAWRVDAPGGTIRARPGHKAPAPLRPSAIVTGYNPASDPRTTDDENRRADARLRERIAALGSTPWRALAIAPGDDRRWDERGWSIGGEVREAAVALGRDFGQNAIVWIDGDGEVAIVCSRNGFCGAMAGDVLGG